MHEAHLVHAIYGFRIRKEYLRASKHGELLHTDSTAAAVVAAVAAAVEAELLYTMPYGNTYDMYEYIRRSD